MFTFLSVIRQNFEFIQFSRKNSKIYGFRPYLFKKLQLFFGFFNIYYTFYTKNLFLTMKVTQSFVKISFLVKFLYF